MTKRCPKCTQELPAEMFSIRAPGKLTSYCKRCQRAYCKEHYQRYVRKHNTRRNNSTQRYRSRNRVLLMEYLRTHPCVDCGEADQVVLELDHVRGAKSCEISVMVAAGRSWKRIEDELAKCVVRCANCHRRKTAIDLRWYKSLVAGM